VKRSISLGVALVVLSLTACARREADSPRTVVLLSLDTVRADRLGAYGRDDGPTPAIDALIASGVKFERCLAVAPITLPSHASLLAGVDPIAHGLRVNGTGTFPSELAMVQEAYGAAGYATGGFVSASVLDRQFGLGRGFQRYDDAHGSAQDATSEERRGAATIEAALGWLAEQRGDAFVFVHLFDAHQPYAAPGEYGGRHDDPYDAELAYLDDCVKRLLAGLEIQGRGDALFALTADHGEGLGDHGESTHTIFVYDTTIRVPLAIRGEGLESGRVVTGTASSISVAPTLLELSGIAVPASMYAPSLVAALRGEGEAPGLARFESLAPEYYYGFAPLAGFEQGDAKLIVAPRPELYFPRRDPGEITDHFASDRATGDALKRELDAYERRHETARAKPAPLDDAMRERLAQMGYISVSRQSSGRDPKDGIAMVEAMLAAEQLSASDLVAAIDTMEAAIAADPSVAEAHEFLASLLLRAGPGRIERAIDSYRRAIALRPHDAVLYGEIAEAHYARGDLENSRANLETALMLDPAQKDARVSLAKLLLQQGEFHAARTQVGMVLRGDAGKGLIPAPDHVPALAVEGQASVLLGDGTAARLALARAAELESRQPGVLMLLAGLAEELGDRERACRFYAALEALLVEQGADPDISGVAAIEQRRVALGCK
jgi:arylsulfatase A-like enzyme/Tfp pilus assembly protein PilF